MTFKTVYDKIKGVPFISDANAKILYEFIVKNKPAHVLELGIAHGTASCYIAAALDEIGTGKLTCVDLLDVKDTFKPSIETQLASLGLTKYVDIHRMKSGYNWYLHNEIRACSKNDLNVCIPKYDLIIIDGPKNWTIDSSSFYLSDKLLKENGWIIWDDYNWTYANANDRRESTDGISHRSMSEEELILPHIKEIFHLLVMQHPDYGNFIINDANWAWANKKRSDVKNIKFNHSRSVTYMINTIIRKIVKRLS